MGFHCLSFSPNKIWHPRSVHPSSQILQATLSHCSLLGTNPFLAQEPLLALVSPLVLGSPLAQEPLQVLVSPLVLEQVCDRLLPQGWVLVLFFARALVFQPLQVLVPLQRRQQDTDLPFQKENDRATAQNRKTTHEIEQNVQFPCCQKPNPPLGLRHRSNKQPIRCCTQHL